MRIGEKNIRDIIEGKNIILRPITMEDTDNVVRWRNDPEVLKNFIFRGEFTKDTHVQWMKTKVANQQVIQYMILTKKERLPVGSVYFRDINRENNSAEYGIFIGEASARGRGIGTEAAKLFIRFGFERLKLHRISLRVLAENKIAYQVYENAGFVKEGIFRDMVFLDGRYQDVIFMAVLKEN